MKESNKKDEYKEDNARKRLKDREVKKTKKCSTKKNKQWIIIIIIIMGMEYSIQYCKKDEYTKEECKEDY